MGLKIDSAVIRGDAVKIQEARAPPALAMASLEIDVTISREDIKKLRISSCTG